MNRHMFKLLKIFGVTLAVFAAAAWFFALDFFVRNELVLPRTVIGDMHVAGMSRDSLKQALTARSEKYLTTPFLVAARGEVVPITLAQLDVAIDIEDLLNRTFTSQKSPRWQTALLSIGGRRINPKLQLTGQLSRTKLLHVLEEKFPSIPKPRNAYFKREGTNTIIIEGEKGSAPNVDKLLGELQKSITYFETPPLFVELTEISPTLFAADLEKYKTELRPLLAHSIELFYGEDKRHRWQLTMSANPDWILFDTKPYEVAAGELPLRVEIDPVKLAQFIKDGGVDEALEQKPEDVRIWQQVGGDKITIEGRGYNGRAIAMDSVVNRVTNALNRKTATIEVPLIEVPYTLDIAQELHVKGIKEVVAVGHTRFAGSPANRKHNVGVGVSKYNGLLIAPGETFSFNKNLGEVDASTGYKKELVIKPEGTIPEYGGGLCQVSTTLYRAALYAGLPIKERAPHSYAVTYYSQIGGHGIDATIYPPARDLKFINDTPGPLLIHSFVDGDNAYFKFYGTKDDRTVAMEGPYVSNKRSAPSDPLVVYDAKLKPGEKKQVEKAHGGFDTLWYRSITKNGETKKEEIVSKYKATQNKYLTGDKPAEIENKEVAEVNPFE